MRGRSLTTLLLAALVGGLIGATLLTLPPSPRPLQQRRGLSAGDVAGAYHVHSNRSDGTGTVDDIARAAAEAGLQFVILTDHGDGTRQPDPPRYIHGVLVIDAVEISTVGGHYVALGLQNVPYRLAGEARDVVEDVHRFGGFGIVAHPASLKPALAWQAWQTPYDGIEWLNADSEWRDERLRTILWSLWHYPLRPAESMAAILDRPADVLERWDRVLEARPVVALAAVDAHARLGRLGNLASHEAVGSIPLAIPSYETSFRTFSVRARVRTALTGSADSDATAVIAAIREGRVHTVVDAIAPSGRFVFTAQSGAARTEMGGRLLLDGPLELKVDADMPAGARVVTFRNGEALRTGGKTAVHRSDRRRGVYRVEIQVPGAPGLPSVPWVLSNPIHVDEVPHALTEAEPQPERGPAPLRLGAATVEHDPSSSIELTRESVDKVQMVRLTYELGGGPRQSQYVALVVPRNGIPARFNRLAFTGSASRPMRMSLQVRNEAGERWQRSVYLDSLPRTVRLEFDELTRIEHPNQAGRPPLDQVRAILAVVDTVNTTPGSSGTVTIEGLRFSR